MYMYVGIILYLLDVFSVGLPVCVDMVGPRGPTTMLLCLQPVAAPARSPSAHKCAI